MIASKGPRSAERASSSSELAVLRINVTESYVEAHLRPVQDAATKQAALRAAFLDALEQRSE